MENKSYFNNIKSYNKHYVGWLRNLEFDYIQKFFRKYLIKSLTLEVGSGNGFYSKEIQKYVNQNNSIHLDQSLELLKNINGNTVCADYLNTPFHEKQFNQIVCMGAVEFIGEDFFSVTHKLLRDNGICFICIPRNNIFGFFYKRFYKQRNIDLLFYSDELKERISKKFKILSSSSFLLNQYLVLEKINQD